MDSNTEGFTAYWRNALADAESGKGTFERKDEEKFIRWRDTDSARLDEETLQALFDGEASPVKLVDVLLRPEVWFRLIEHGKVRTAGAPGMITPLVIAAKVSREGFLFPTAHATLPRDLLEPLANGSLTIGLMSVCDQYRTTQNTFVFVPPDEVDEETEEEREIRHEGYQQAWQQHQQQTTALLEHVAGEWRETHEQYLRADYGLIVKASAVSGAAQHILALYDDLLISKKPVPLLARYAAQTSPATEPLLNASAQFSHRLGHAGDTFPLATAQRDALSHYLTQQTGDILAVNGPPGTGKTTLVLSIIATEWARAALAKGEPLLVIATSTNNQAVTNIIEAFGKDFGTGSGVMAGRWLPGLKSFGAYFPSQSLKAEAALKYQTEDFFSGIENQAYLEEARVYYLEKARAAFPAASCTSPAQVVDLLHQRLSATFSQLEQLASDWQTLERAQQARRAVSDNMPQYLADAQAGVEAQQQRHTQLSDGKKRWRKYLADESLLYALFSWIPAVRNKRQLKMSDFLDETMAGAMAGFHGSLPDEVDGWLQGQMDQTDAARQGYQQQWDAAQAVCQREQQAAAQWQAQSRVLGYCDDALLTLAQADELADTQLRFPAFQLACHYWEGRWLMEMAGIKDIAKENRRNGAQGVQARWLRRMKLTPCVVMTCYMLPSHMKVSEFVSQNNYDKSYFYNAADLLIVDEAGQVLPEVAAASFALAKKALVIGDTEQIAPIWSSQPAIDIGNMLEKGILQGATQEALREAYTAIGHSGKSAASGSVMKIAQFSSRYQYDADLARGMYLYEHRRCFDNIVGYCNALCYHGKLQPKRGAASGTLFPAMGYLHIDGKAAKASGGSRYNALEAQTIAAWLAENQQKIEQHYNKPLHQVVGVVTPFTAQKNAIRRALQPFNINAFEGDDALTVGTVHALQGAERALVLFSPVYSKHEDGGFIDSENSLLNVAVSRAKDSFLVFGDMDLFEVQPRSTPRGMLAEYLFADVENALQFAVKQREDLQAAQTRISTLHGVDQHDDFMHQTLGSLGKNITIVSPWLSWQKLEQTGFLASMDQALARGVAITVVTDKSYNTRDKDYAQRQEKKQRLESALTKLHEMGVTTRLVERVHSKIVIGDDGLLCVGSFNWFSASRDSAYQIYDTSMVYRGENMKGEIATIWSSLEKRRL